jgi:hypothetical protein
METRRVTQPSISALRRCLSHPHCSDQQGRYKQVNKTCGGVAANIQYVSTTLNAEILLRPEYDSRWLSSLSVCSHTDARSGL